MSSLVKSAAICFALAIVFVAAGVVWRWHGARTPTAAFVAWGR